MASFLSRLGRFSFRRRWLVVLLWVVLLLGTGVLAGRAPAAPPNDFSMPGTEAQQAYDLLNERFPELKADGATARVVFRAEDGRVTGPEAKKVGEALRYDDTHDAQLLLSVRTCMERDRRTDAAAAALHIHPNTLAYRLRRFSTLTGRDLTSTGAFTEVWMAIRSASELGLWTAGLTRAAVGQKPSVTMRPPSPSAMMRPTWVRPRMRDT
ncbi:helix-turn-helix domain-containing protein [Streptomyces sp. NPDC001020]